MAQSLLYMRETVLNEYENKNSRDRFTESENDQWERKSIVQWPTIAEFIDKNVGLEKINEYIEKVNEDFKYNLNNKFFYQGMENNIRWSRCMLVIRN